MIVGSLDQADFPWEDVDLGTAGLQEFARTGATLDWNLGFSILSSRAGAGPFDTTVTVDVAAGLPVLHADAGPTGPRRPEPADASCRRRSPARSSATDRLASA